MLDFISGTSTCNIIILDEFSQTSECFTHLVPNYINSSSTATTTDIVSQADIAIVTLLFAILIAIITVAFTFSLSRVYQHRKYLQYGGGDVEVRRDL